jgi:hypothetical protein
VYIWTMRLGAGHIPGSDLEDGGQGESE